MEFFCQRCQKPFKTSEALASHHRFHAASFRKTTDDPLEPNIESPKIETVATETIPIFTNPDDFAPTIVRVKKLPHGIDLPDLARATPGSAAVDLYAAIDKPQCVGATERAAIPTGIAVKIPEGFVGKVVPRSGLAFKHGISLVNTPGVIDEDYTGELMVCLINHSTTKYWVEPGDRIAQMLIERVEPVRFEYTDELSQTARGQNGFGSSGR